MAKVALFFLLAAATAAPAHAASVTPGEAAWVPLGVTGTAGVRAWFGRRAVLTEFHDNQWYAVAAIPAGQPPGEYLIRYRAEGEGNRRERFRTFTVGAPRPFVQVADLRLPAGGGAEWWWRDAEVLRRTAVVDDRRPQLRFTPPVDAPPLFPFDARTSPGAPLAGTIGVAFEVAADTAVTVPAAAVATPLRARGCGGGIILDHGGGLFSIFCGLGEAAQIITPGAQLARGDPIALLRPAQNSTAVVHWSVRMNGTWINPAGLVAR